MSSLSAASRSTIQLLIQLHTAADLIVVVTVFSSTNFFIRPRAVADRWTAYITTLIKTDYCAL